MLEGEGKRRGFGDTGVRLRVRYWRASCGGEKGMCGVLKRLSGQAARRIRPCAQEQAVSSTQFMWATTGVSRGKWAVRVCVAGDKQWRPAAG